MHIPDGYLSPQTSAVFTVAMVPMWWQSARRVRRVVKSRYVPLLALGAAFSFVIMMFNVPIPDGTTAHAVGGGLIAILLGPWAGCVAVSIALLIQALFFGDGGVLVFPANAFNMAVVLPFVAYGVYRLLSRNAALTSRRRIVAGAVGAYVGLNAAALAAAVEFGLQPDLFHRADGMPLYAPFHLAQTIPAMMLAHLVVAGVVEAILTAGVVAYLQRANVPLLRINAPDVPLTDAEVRRRPVSPVKAGLATLVIFAVVSPLGLLAPGGAFGEDAPEDLDLAKYHLSAVPTGLAKYTDFWGHTLLPGYGNGGAWQYILSAVVGMAVIAALVAALAWGLRRLRGGEVEARDLDEPERVADGQETLSK
ncbi:cobalt transporter CbiM [Actinopolymorpha pittospori]|uniref:Cobalt/nickel transport system permease protein n=1 Tax=Actinopolymorpha pittospori TaxID=648752 RepID=A0A927N247_9ACTN|nr:cobalt/nickel transport system permease protein [Actinopolymorpha pittospori]